MLRYLIRPVPLAVPLAGRSRTRQQLGIFDTRLRAFCTLRDENDNLLPLEFNTTASAAAWLAGCRIAWAEGRAPEPDGWRTQQWAPPGGTVR